MAKSDFTLAILLDAEIANAVATSADEETADTSAKLAASLAMPGLSLEVTNAYYA